MSPMANQLNNLDWHAFLEQLAAHATCDLARSALMQMSACESPQMAQERCQEVIQAQRVLERGSRPHMESLDTFGLWHPRLEKGATLQPRELRDTRHFCVEVLALSKALKELPDAWPQRILSALLEAQEPLSAIDHLMTLDGELRTDASETLHRLHRERTSLARQTQQILDRLIHKHELEPLLQERYVTTREGRWVLPVRSGMQQHFEGILHGSSQTKQTVFMEPKEIIPLNNRLREVEVLIEEEIERLLADLSNYLRGLTSSFVASRAALLEADQRLAQAQVNSLLNGQTFEFDDSKIVLPGLRHPLLALGSEGRSVVPNSVTLDRQHRILLLSGPNAGGKTVLLKSIGLAAQMARCGLPICTESGSRFPFFKTILVGVGDAQSVDAHLSTFAAHLSVLQQASELHGQDCLCLIDEICGSTDPEEGAALARSFIEAFSANQIFAVITSHLTQLKRGWPDGSGVLNGSLEYQTETGRPTYHFLAGVPGQSMALMTAKRAGVSADIVERAVQHLSPEARHYLSGLNEIELLKTELQQARDRLEQERSMARREREKFQKLSQKFEQERDRMLEQAIVRAEKKVESLLERQRAEDVFRRHEVRTKQQIDLPQIIKSRRSQASPSTLKSAEDFAKAFPPGSKVFATNLQRDAVVQGSPNSRGEVPILSSSMRLLVPWEQLKPPSSPPNPIRPILRDTAPAFAGRGGPQDRSVDLRGKSTEEAIAVLEQQIDSALQRGDSRIRIIHGHGTDTLKRAVRQFLSRSPLVQKWRAGTPDTGGDGVTWVEF